MSDENVVYIVCIATGSYSDSYGSIQFVTLDKAIANDWVRRYNKIVEDNTVRLKDFTFKQGCSKTPFGYDEIVYGNPLAFVDTSFLRR